MEMKNIVASAENYGAVDGRNSHRSDISRFTMGFPTTEGNAGMPVAVQIWRKTDCGVDALACELPIHRVMDLMIFLSRVMQYFRESYRLPLLYDPDNPVIDRIGVQGGVMPVEICTDNENIIEDVKKFSDYLGELGELTGERLRVLAKILEEMEYY